MLDRMATLADELEARGMALDRAAAPLRDSPRKHELTAQAGGLRESARRIRAEIAECEAEGDRAP